jgi:ribosomal protein S9
MERKRITGYTTDEQLVSDWAAYVEHLGVSESASVEWVIRDQIRRWQGENSKENMLAELLKITARIESKLDITLLTVWKLGGGEAVQATAADVARLRALVAALREG